MDAPGHIAVVGDEDDFEGWRAQIPRPAGGNDGVHLGGAVDAQDGELAVAAEARGRVGLALDFGVDGGAGGEEGRVGEEAAGGGGAQERVPGGCDGVLGCSSGWRVCKVGGGWGGVEGGGLTCVDEGYGVRDCLLGVRFEGFGHGGEWWLPFERRS